jgi:choline dehydrogenase
LDGAYDSIVTGAGSAGCAVAGRLSEDGRYRVLLLEAGPRDTYPWIHIPLGYHKTFNNPRVNWMFDSEPEPELNDRVLYQPRGKVLGGTSSINGMVYMRGNAADYDEWRQRGCEGWDYESGLPYFKRAEDSVRGADAFHGTGGPKVSDHRWQPTLARAMHDAAVQAGIPANPDFNGARQEGVGYYQTTIDKARRWSSARAYLGNARRRRNLTIATGAHATRILIMNDLAISLRHRLKAVLQYAFGQTGPLASMGLLVGALVRSDKRLERPDLQIDMFAWAVKERNRNGVVPQPFSAFGLSPVHLRPDGRGTVRLGSPDPLAAPEIRFNFLKSVYDFQALIEGVRICREIARHSRR